MPQSNFAARPSLLLEDQPISDDIEAALIDLVVESDVHAPDSCIAVFADPNRDLLSRSTFDFAKTIVVKAGRIGEYARDVLFEGNIYSLGFDFDEHGATTTVTAYDKSYALFNGLHTGTYLQKTDSDLAKQLAEEVELEPGNIDTTSVVHDHISQANETHWDLLVRRAQEIGFEVRVIGTKLHFCAPASADDGPEGGDYDEANRLQLTPGESLREFSSRMTAAQQVGEVEVRGWDVKNKEALVAVQRADTRAVKCTDTYEKVAGGNDGSRHVTVHLPLGTKAECDAAAAAASEWLASTYVYAEGTVTGDPQILAGAAVGIGKTGGHLDGTYTISRAVHSFGRDGYETRFIVSGGHDRTLHGLVTNGKVATDRIPGVVVALVTNVSDDEKAARVKLKFPWLSDDYESDWARVVQLGAGDARGLQLLPEVNDEVLVAFDHGDIRRPYVVGGLYNGVDSPPFDDAVDSGSGKVAQRGLKSRIGHTVLLDDTDGSEKIEIQTSDGKVTVTLDQASSAITIDVDKDVSVTAGGNVEVKADQDISIEASGNATLKGSQGVTIEASGDLTLKGATISLN
jgi:phage protein D/phage baseplate assembly protein gpV